MTDNLETLGVQISATPSIVKEGTILQFKCTVTNITDTLNEYKKKNRIRLRIPVTTLVDISTYDQSLTSITSFGSVNNNRWAYVGIEDGHHIFKCRKGFLNAFESVSFGFVSLVNVDGVSSPHTLECELFNKNNESSLTKLDSEQLIIL